MNTKIYLKGVRAYGYVGLLPEENVLGQWFEVDATLWVDFEAATHSDRLEDTYDYRQSINVIENLIKTAKFALVERLAGAIADGLLEDSTVEQVLVRVIKRPPIPEFQGSITVEVIRRSIPSSQSTIDFDLTESSTSLKSTDANSSESSLNQPEKISAETVKKSKSLDRSSEKFKEGKSIASIYTDGACSGNPGAGGWGTLINFSDGTVEELSGSSRQTTNNQMEMQAAIAALEYLSAHPQPDSIPLYTDSKYVNWKRNNWKTSSKQPVKNQELWQHLDRLNSQHKVQWNWVEGHSGNPGNERCDAIARQQIRGNG
jgi:ribonuclease HI